MQQAIVACILFLLLALTTTQTYANHKHESNPVTGTIHKAKKKATHTGQTAADTAAANQRAAAAANQRAAAAAEAAKQQAAATAATTAAAEVAAQRALVASYTKQAAAGMPITPVNPAVTSGKCSAKNSGTAVGYCNYMDVDIKASGLMFGQEHVFGPGMLKTQVSGAAEIVVYADEVTGSIGATATAKQIVTLGFFGGKPFDLGLSCSFTEGGQSEYTLNFGASMSTPPIPSLSVTDILEGIAAGGAIAKKIPLKVINQLRSVQIPCTVVMPDMELFSGVPAINIYTVASTMTIAAQNWNISDDAVAVDIVVSSGVTAQLGGTEIEVSGKGVDQPFKTQVFGLGYQKDFVNLVKMPVKIDL